MAREKDYKEIRKKILESLEKAINQGSWESSDSLFIRNIGKRLIEIHSRAAKALSVNEAPLSVAAAKNRIEQDGHIRVYISIYQADGINLESWRTTIKGLTEYTISRPIYKQEAHIKSLMGAKIDSQCSAYVCVDVKESDIVPAHAGKPIQDKFGHELLTLREGSVKLENIVEFVHQGRVYNLAQDELVSAISSEKRWNSFA